MTRLAPCVVLTIVAAACAAPQDSPDASREIEMMEQQLAAAWVAGDRPTIERMIADDWMTADGSSSPPTGHVCSIDASMPQQPYSARRRVSYTVSIALIPMRMFHGTAECDGQRPFSGCDEDVHNRLRRHAWHRGAAKVLQLAEPNVERL